MRGQEFGQVFSSFIRLRCSGEGCGYFLSGGWVRASEEVVKGVDGGSDDKD